MSQVAMFDMGRGDEIEASEDPHYTTRQLITYIGNKRGLAGPIEQAMLDVRNRLGGRQLRTLDLFSGSGFVSRLMKKHSSFVAANDLEDYARAVSECYLPNRDEPLLAEAATHVARLNRAAADGASHAGFIRELYSPADDQNIQQGERVFYSNDNARRLDYYAQELTKLPDEVQRLLRGPLLSKASVHANTGGVFKGFYKDKHTGIGKFGAAAGDATTRILAPIRLELPTLSLFETEHQVFQEDANAIASQTGDFDLVYIDPPYNQHPYGSNYFMLNLLTDYRRPTSISKVSGIPTDWNRSGYNVRKQSLPLLESLFEEIPARFLLVSFNSEGYVSTDELRGALEQHGRVDEEILKYNTFRASRNLRSRDIHVHEHLFLLDRES
ncbi:DNA adenine methylase [Phycicoccus sp. BSK3Z-2]|uniref:site-specific DNA-methyltransferase (adenine-specific) n=1 Tax=Phycicoccus avicenniae TaxID=2828860 RepID=A0A941DCG5_9MICO|nr:DNA adenine methylase [Phycicoccus avicenniae]MBR7743802.1 DNA adenine methylase [Phycicoccus avicenniae]